MGTLNLQPQITRKWNITKQDLEKMICAELGVKPEEVIIAFNVTDTEYDDRFGPHYQFASVTVTSR